MQNDDVTLSRSNNIKIVAATEVEAVKTFDHPLLDNIMLLFNRETIDLISKEIKIPLKDLQFKIGVTFKKLYSLNPDGSLLPKEIQGVVNDLNSILKEHSDEDLD